MSKLLIFLLMLLSPAHAWAAASLVSSDPAEGEVITSFLNEIRLTFDQPVAVDQFVLLDGDGRPTGGMAPVFNDGNDIVLPLATELPLGKYVVSYSVVSEGTQPIVGTYAFFVGEFPAVRILRRQIVP
jgi:copper transport protein